MMLRNRQLVRLVTNDVFSPESTRTTGTLRKRCICRQLLLNLYFVDYIQTVFENFQSMCSTDSPLLFSLSLSKALSLKIIFSLNKSLIREINFHEIS